MEQLGEEIGRMLRPGDLVVLTGPLGAGKTTLTRGIAQGLGVRGPVQSPTFVIARTHPSLVDGAPLVHIDAYRLGSPAELDDLDIDFEASVVIVEWGRGMVDGLRDAWWEVELDRDGPTRPEAPRDALEPTRPGAPRDAPAARGEGVGTARGEGVGSHGRGQDDACYGVAHEAELDADTPRRVTIARRP
ncbi:tRNA (adenosine(37)-N6)-threonylcarbamoyltransferase complex ATPase subunit type 1 TsaE [Microbacterium sp. HD4P20]|uniref:tRNA (adenosine(37)-N6)-threonylcarbamoyltransferase complex ATPase subunit type 1 TsaE n=1 Tax=Microbacterium sp. HD4P20 TaxID=2864874 RepID=UPI0035AC1E35